MSLDENKDIVRRHYEELFNNRNLDVAAEITAMDYVEHGVAALAERVGDRPDPIEGLKETVRG